jgi:hypothetical protein
VSRMIAFRSKLSASMTTESLPFTVSAVNEPTATFRPV